MFSSSTGFPFASSFRSWSRASWWTSPCSWWFTFAWRFAETTTLCAQESASSQVSMSQLDILRIAYTGLPHPWWWRKKSLSRKIHNSEKLRIYETKRTFNLLSSVSKRLEQFSVFPRFEPLIVIGKSKVFRSEMTFFIFFWLIRSEGHLYNWNFLVTNNWNEIKTKSKIHSPQTKTKNKIIFSKIKLSHLLMEYRQSIKAPVSHDRRQPKI